MGSGTWARGRVTICITDGKGLMFLIPEFTRSPLRDRIEGFLPPFLHTRLWPWR